jgi:predicted alternative tryptophan synthase beta-subunit
MSSAYFDQMSRAMGAAAFGVVVAPETTHAATVCVQNCSSRRALCERDCPFVNSGHCRLNCINAESNCKILCGR